MATRNVVLTDRQEERIDALVGSGRYQNASEVLREGLRLIEQREAEDAAKLQALRDAVKVGSADIAAGRYREFADVKELSAHLSEKSKSALRNAKRR